jgi:hypothetical protein
VDVTFVEAVAEGVNAVTPKIKDAARAAETMTRELLLETCEIERIEFMILVMTEANSAQV